MGDRTPEAEALERLEELLTPISEGRGPFSRDNHTFAENVIEASKEGAIEALSVLATLRAALSSEQSDRDWVSLPSSRARRRSMAMLTEAGRELDALVAEKVMGWYLEHMSSYSFQGWHDASGERTGWTETPDDYDSLRNFIGVWAPSTDIAAAWAVVEKMVPTANLSEPWFKLYTTGGKWACNFHYNTADEFAPTAPLAICRAALKACGNTGETEP